MKKTLVTILMLFATASYAGGEIKEVCRDEQKNGKTVKVCKKIKVHKKLEGTQFPDKPAKK